MKYIITAVCAAAVWLLYANSFSISESESVVFTRFGKPVATIASSGFEWRQLGFLEQANRIDRRIRTFSIRPIQLLLGDKNPIVLTCYICWRVSDPLLYFQSLTTPEIAAQKLEDTVNSQLGGALGNFTLANIINTNQPDIKLAELEAHILQHATAIARTQYGIEVIQVGIRRIAYPTIVADSVYNRMRSEREKEARKFRAEGMEEAAKIKAKADREAAEILAEAYRQSQILKGEGDQQALKIYADAYGKDKEFFEFTKSMEVYKDMFSSKSTLILSTDSPLLRYLNNPKGAPDNDRP